MTLSFIPSFQVPDGSKGIRVGTLIALTVAEGEDYKDIDMPTEASGASPVAETATAESDTSTDAESSSISYTVGKARLAAYS